MSISKHDLLKITGSLLYGDPKTVWETFPEDLREEYLKAVVDSGLVGFCGHVLLGKVPLPSWAETLIGKCFHEQQIHNVLNDVSAAALFDKFEKASVRFLPIKGIELSVRVYPEPGMRLFGDWDVLFHPDDIQRGLEVLSADGWKVQNDYPDDWCHHYPAHLRNGFALEPHWTLPCFGDIDPHEFWRYCHPLKDGGFRYEAEPEFLLLYLARHASEDSFKSVSEQKLLLDAAYVMKRWNIDWTALRTLCGELKQPYPGNLLGAFDEFFPDELIHQMAPQPEAAASYREIYSSLGEYEGISVAEWAMNQEGALSRSWFKKALVIFIPKNMRQKYHLPETGKRWLLAWCYIKDIGCKILNFIRFRFHRNPKIRRLETLIRTAEQR